MKSPLSSAAAELLSDPDIQAVMAAYGVHGAGLRDMLESVGANRDGAPGPLPDRRYRFGVGMVVVNRRGQILLGQRSDRADPAWQMPQGGIGSGEAPHQAALRELKEEIGTAAVQIVAEAGDWLRYDLPDHIADPLARIWRGQCQKWFLVRFTGTDNDIDIATEHPEFSAWRWASVVEVFAAAVEFKRPVYAAALREFAPALASISQENRWR